MMNATTSPAADQPPSTAPTGLFTAFIKSVAIVVSVHLQTLASQGMIQSLGSSNMIKKAVDFVKIIKKVWDDDPRRGTHCFKVALAIAFVSSVYYVRPLYNGGIGDAAIITTLVVISVSEYTTGRTLSKCINNAYATTVGCALGVGAESLGGLIGELSRECAYHIEALSGYLDEKVPSAFQITVQESCMKMSSEVGKALKDLGNSLSLMERSCASVVHMKICKMVADNLNMTLKASLIGQQDDILKAISVIAATSILVDIIKCVDKISKAIQGLSKEAGFKNP
ncbi:aluminum-activated malate transporter 8-like [Bidens hawaiensis]|uniref:aluminum-activated malate transporter 8-like n=1 Tax=Bidens hawaiensis TaxID=980011 RepID=UPI00404975FC